VAGQHPEDLVEEFEVEQSSGDGPGEDPAAGGPDFNVAPTKRAVVVLERPSRPGPVAPPADDPAAGAADEEGDATADAAVAAAGEGPDPGAVRWLRLFTWGLVPGWAESRGVGSRMINARAETVLERPAYRRAALHRRCLVPADGWYEWQPSSTGAGTGRGSGQEGTGTGSATRRGKPRKQPFYLHPVDGGVVAFAGLYEFWRDPTRHPDDPQAWLASFAIITTEAEPGLDVVHDRMPLVLPRDRWDAWLDPELRAAGAVQALLRRPDPGRFVAEPVSTSVNSVARNGPELLTPVPWESLHGVVDPRTGELLGGGPDVLF
jgi:putative SOS response-associated peptidase YedK